MREKVGRLKLGEDRRVKRGVGGEREWGGGAFGIGLVHLGRLFAVLLAVQIQ